jgi:hypothetical protein
MNLGVYVLLLLSMHCIFYEKIELIVQGTSIVLPVQWAHEPSSQMSPYLETF